MTPFKVEDYELLKRAFDEQEDIPPAQRIALALIEAINNGILVEGDKLPSIRRISSLMHTSKNSVSAAMDILASKGFINIEPNRGAYVLNQQRQKGWVWDKFYGISHQEINPIHKHESWRDSIFLKKSINLSNRLDESWDSYSGFDYVAPYIQKVIQNLKKEVYRDLYNEQGLPALRELLSQWLQTKGIKAEPGNILLVSRRVQAYKIISDTLFAPEVTVGFQKENFLNAYQTGMAKILKKVFLETDEEGLLIGNLLREQGKKILVIQPTRNEPTGTMTYQKRREQIYASCARAGIPIIEEYVSAPFYQGEKKVKPIKALDKEDIVIHVGGVREALTPGTSLEWIVAPKQIIGRMLVQVRRDILFASEFNQMLLTEILRAGKLDEFYLHQGNIFDKKFPIYANLVNEYFKGIATFSENQVWGRIWLTFKKPVKVSHLYATRENVDFQPGIIYGDTQDASIMLYLFGDIGLFEEGLKRLRTLVNKIYQI